MTSHDIFTGVGVVMTTPFTANGEVDEEGLQKHTRFLVEGGITRGNGWLVPTGSTGECYALTNDERARVWEIVIDAAAGQVPVVVGTNHANTREAIELSRRAEHLGAAATMNLAPFYHALDKTAYLTHYKQLSNAVDIPVQIYTNPYVSGFEVPVEWFAELADLEHIEAVKFVSTDVLAYEKLSRLRGRELIINNGLGEPWEPLGFICGSPGVVSGHANYMPEVIVEMVSLGRQGRYDDMYALLKAKINPLSDLMYRELPAGGYVPVQIKYIEKAKGLIKNSRGRAPFIDLSAEIAEKTDRIMASIGLA